MADNRKIKISISMGLVGCKREFTEDLPDDWDELSAREQTEYLNELYEMHRDNTIAGDAWVEGEKE